MVTLMPDDEEPTDRIYRALGDPTRRRLLQRLAERPGLSTGQLVTGVPGLSRWAVMKHIGVLRECDLVQTLPQGRRRRHYADLRALEGCRDWLARLAGSASETER
jgi:DNA-binding transcriptional ArsR family regulator